MRKVICCFWLTTSLSLFAGSSDPLWLRAVDIAESIHDWRPGEVRTVQEELDRKQRTKNREEYLMIARPGSDGTIVVEHWMIEKGQRKPYTPEDEEDEHEALSFGPLDRSAQDYLAVRRLALTERVGEENCAVFDYAISPTNEPVKVSGRIWLNENSAELRKMTVELDPIPDDLKSLSMTYWFQSLEPGTIQPRKMLTDLSASVFLITKRFRITQECDAFFKRSSL